MQQNSASAAHLPGRDPQMASADPTSFDWSDLLDFNLDETLYAPFPDIGSGSVPEPDRIQPSDNSGRVRKRDPRLVCSNFLAGRVPCACPELDAMLAEEEKEPGLPGKKRARVARAAGGSPSPMRCQVPGCEVDISELKGYHKRHRVCLRCATESSVVLDGESKRYCQQCGKFHLLSDFDEGKRSCRRKLERHNNRRKRKPSASKGGIEKDTQQVAFADDASADDDAGKDINRDVILNSQIEERELLLEPDGHVSTLCSALESQNLQGDSVASIVQPGEVHIHGPIQNPSYTHSPSYCDNKNTFSSMCPPGRISFKLYDWNPAEFPRRLRHQIFQWLASMPIELEGYIRPGCTILTAFIAMPKPMWRKLLEDPALCIRNLVQLPRSLLSERGTMLVYLNDMIFRVTEDGNSIVKVRMKDRSPKLHYIHPNCFEAGRPMEFVACGRDLLQPKFRFLVSLAGRYLPYNIYVSSLCCMKGDRKNSFDHQLVKISIPHSDPSIIGPAFIEVENQSGLSNFIPILIGDKETCAEMEILQQSFEPEPPSRPACRFIALRQANFSEFLLDVAWSLKKPVSGQCLTSSHVQRFNYLLDFLIEKESSVILKRVICSLKYGIDDNLVAGISEADMRILRIKIEIAESMLGQELGRKDLKVMHGLHGNVYSQSSEKDAQCFVPAYDTEKPKNTMWCTTFSSSPDAGPSDPLLNREVVMNVSNLHAMPHKPCSPLLPFRPLITAFMVIGVCLGVCAAAFHPQRVSQMAITIRRCLFNNS